MNYQGRRRRGNRRKRRNRPLAEPCDDYYVVIDFEATTRQIAEIIEFPALLIDARTLEYVSQFHSYVRPVIYRYLDKRCKRLTGITQVLFIMSF